MNIDIRTRALNLDDALKARVHLRLHFALDRVGVNVHRVNVYLSDENGPRGGVDKVCRVVVELWGGRDLVVVDRDSDLRVAIDRAADRVGSVVRRAMQRVRFLRGRDFHLQN